MFLLASGCQCLHYIATSLLFCRVMICTTILQFKDVKSDRNQDKQKPVSLNLTLNDIKAEISRLIGTKWRGKNKEGNDKDESTHKKHSLKEWWKDWWIQEPEKSPKVPIPSNDVCVASLISDSDYFLRLASFCGASVDELQGMSTTIFASAGFSFSNGKIRCEGCGSVQELRGLKYLPSDARNHGAYCRFVAGGGEVPPFQSPGNHSGDSMTPDATQSGQVLNGEETHSGEDASGWQQVNGHPNNNGAGQQVNGHPNNNGAGQTETVDQSESETYGRTNSSSSDSSDSDQGYEEGRFLEETEHTPHEILTVSLPEEQEDDSEETVFTSEESGVSMLEGTGIYEDVQPNISAVPQVANGSVPARVGPESETVSEVEVEEPPLTLKELQRQARRNPILAAKSAFHRLTRQRFNSTSSSDSGFSSSSSSSSASTRSVADADASKSSQIGRLKDVDDSAYFNVEVGEVEKRSTSVQILSVKCEKDKVHYGYFPMETLQMVHLPPVLRHDSILSFIRVLSKLTVRLVVKMTSSKRPRDDPALKVKESHKRIGTGMVMISDVGYGAEELAPGAIGGKQKNKKLIYIQTSRQLIYDDKEASSTWVEFFFENMNRSNVISVKASRVIHKTGGQHSVLVCSVKEKDFNTINKYKSEFMQLEQEIPPEQKKEFTKKAVVISYPHGAPAALSHGDCLTLRYTVEGTPRRLKKNYPPIPADVQELYKAVIYTADACGGSSGAPVIFYNKVGELEDGTEAYAMELWMHYAKEKDHRLGVTALKVCSHEEIEEAKKPPPPSEDDEEKEEEPQDDVPNSVRTPEFTEFSKRLESFKNGWSASHIHSPALVAFAGFYYAGYDDCIRCFYCGIGLRRWKKGDNVFKEHKRHKSRCLFLEMQFRLYGEEELTSGKYPEVKLGELTSLCIGGTTQSKLGEYASVASDDGRETAAVPMGSATVFETKIDPTNGQRGRKVTGEFLMIGALRKENERLQEQILCKICHHQMVKDLFLPCSHLCSCPDCCKLLSHCPVCSKQIVATVATYFT